MQENKERIEELERQIQELQNELHTVWKNWITDAAEATITLQTEMAKQFEQISSNARSRSGATGANTYGKARDLDDKEGHSQLKQYIDRLNKDALEPYADAVGEIGKESPVPHSGKLPVLKGGIENAPRHESSFYFTQHGFKRFPGKVQNWGAGPDPVKLIFKVQILKKQRLYGKAGILSGDAAHFGRAVRCGYPKALPEKGETVPAGTAAQIQHGGVWGEEF